MGNKGHVPSIAGRKRAIELKAADANQLLNAQLPFVVPLLTSLQVKQIQDVLDAAVVNPEIEKEYQEMMKKSIRAQSGSLIMRDENKVNKAYKHLNTRIRVSKSDQYIQLDFRKLLAADALKPRTDNPDEAAYLEAVRQTLVERGIWLRVSQPLVRIPDDYGGWMLDPRQWEVTLSVGRDGDQIKIGKGPITREQLLDTTIFGAGYYRAVHMGGVEQSLEREIKRLRMEINDGLAEHDRLIKRYDDAAPGVAEISDFVGGADLPDRSIWDYPHKLLIKAMEMRAKDSVKGTQAFLVVAAIATRNAAALVAEYAEKSSAGAGSVIKVLKVLKTAGEIAEIGLTVTGVGGAVRGVARTGGKKMAKSEVDELAEKVVNDYVKKNPDIASDLDKVRWIPGPKGTKGGNIKPGSNPGYGTGWHKWP